MPELKKLSWNTVSRWLERAAQAVEQFSKLRLRGFVLQELQLDEIRTFLDRKKRPIWIITVIEVWSRLWPSCVLGRRNYRNIRRLLRDLLNTSFVERHNLTIRQGSSYLHRRTAAHARWPHRLKEHLELLRCHYNFIRPHMALQFGTIFRTPAMQAGLTSRPLTFRQIFSGRVLLVFVIGTRNQSVLTKQRKAA